MTAKFANPNLYTAEISAALQANDLEKAKILENDLELHFSDHFRAMHILATASARRFDWEAAKNYFERVRDLKPEYFATKIEPGAKYRNAVLNCMGIIEGNKSLPVEPNRTSETCQFPSNFKGFLFVSGMPRSGTTALGKMLNIVPEITLFTELYSPYFPHSPTCFSPDAVEAQLGRIGNNVGPKRIDLLKQELEKSKTSSFIGDKLPLFQFSMPQTLELLADHKVVVFNILRDCAYIAASYEQRANNPNDKWNALRDLDNCILELNTTYRFIRDMDLPSNSGFIGNDHEIINLSYDRVFTDLDYAKELIAKLGMDITPQVVKRLELFVEKSKEFVVSPRNEISDSLRKALHEGIDYEAAEAVCRITGIDVLSSIRGVE
jgi:hypothetical protein